MAVVVGVEGYGGLAEPGLRGTEADLRGIGSGWEGEGKEVMAMGREGMDEGGIFEGFGMNEEGRRALGRGEASGLPSTVSWNCTSTSVSTPHVFISFPRQWCLAGPDHMPRSVLFSVYIVYRSTRCRNFVRPVTSCSSARGMSSLPGVACQLYPPTRTATDADAPP